MDLVIRYWDNLTNEESRVLEFQTGEYPHQTPAQQCGSVLAYSVVEEPVDAAVPEEDGEVLAVG